MSISAAALPRWQSTAHRRTIQVKPMNHEQFDSFSRRNALQRGWVPSRAQHLSALKHPGLGPQTKSSPNRRCNMFDAGKDEGKDCDDCSQFIAGRTDLPSAQKPTSAISRNTVSVIDTAAGRVIATVLVAAGSDGIVVSRDNVQVFVSGASASSLSVIDAISDQVARTIVVGKGLQGLAITA